MPDTVDTDGEGDCKIVIASSLRVVPAHSRQCAQDDFTVHLGEGQILATLIVAF